MKIAIDAGHGLNTPGKRSPDGMREYEFNRAVATYAASHLEKSGGIQVLFVHEDKRDVPLKERTAKAANFGADLYISIHANAYGSGWSEANGIETYVYPTKPKEATALANMVQHDLIQVTKLKNRGVKTANFQVLRETKCPAILVECGFMTNRKEASLLKTKPYRKKCGESIANSILAQYQLLPSLHKVR